MICGNNKKTGSCVCDILAEIAEYQKSTEECQGGCPKSLEELVKGFSEANLPNTVPIQLICNTEGLEDGTCGSVFSATGYRRDPRDLTTILTTSSTWFRVNFVDEHKCCAEIELLCTTFRSQADTSCLVEIEALFERSGICVTVDLNCFCGVVCFPAVNAEPAPLPTQPPAPSPS